MLDKQAVSKIADDISHIGGVIQTNFSAAEESAAVSAELSNRAGTLKKLVSMFNF